MKYQEYKELRDAMEQAAHKFYQLRYQMSNGGNLSMRAPGHDWMLVKATDVAFDEVCADTIVVTDFDGNLIEGNRKPSKEALLHGEFRKNKEMNAFLLRGHGQVTVAGTMREAAYLAELVEETAQISLLAGR